MVDHDPSTTSRRPVENRARQFALAPAALTRPDP
jgi:hypothetical protein